MTTADSDSSGWSWFSLPVPWISSSQEDEAGELLSEKPSPRAGHSWVFIPSTSANDDSIFLFGGASVEEGFKNDIWQYQLASSTFSCRKSIHSHPPPPRYEHFSCFLPPISRRPSSPKPVTVPRQDSAVLLNHNHTQHPRILIFGGTGVEGCLQDVWTWDCVKEEFYFHSTSGPKPSPRTCHHSACLISSIEDDLISTSERKRATQELFVWSGGSVGSQPVEDKNLYILDIGNMTWTQHQPSDGVQPPRRLGHSMTRVSNQHILCFGGMENDTVFDDVWLLDIESLQWTEIRLNSAPVALSGHVAVFAPVQSDNVGSEDLIGKLLVHGGLMPDKQINEDIWVLDLESKKWNRFPSSSIPIGIVSSSSNSSTSDVKALSRRLDHSAVLVPRSSLPQYNNYKKLNKSNSISDLRGEAKRKIRWSLEKLGLGSVGDAALGHNDSSDEDLHFVQSIVEKIDSPERRSPSPDIDEVLSMSNPHRYTSEKLAPESVSPTLLSTADGEGDIDALLKIGESTHVSESTSDVDSPDLHDLHKYNDVDEAYAIIFFGGMDMNGMYQDLTGLEFLLS